MTINHKNLVIQHNEIIEAKYKLSLYEQRLIKFLVSMIEPNDEDFKKYTINVSTLCDIFDVKSGDIYQAMEKAIDKLQSYKIKFKDKDDFVSACWLSSSRYQPKLGRMILRFDPELKPFLLQLKEHFTAYEFGNIIKLKHTHSIRIYELLKQYEKIGKRRFLVSDLKSILMIGEDQYKQYRDFRRWVIKVAQVELSQKTDISFSFKEEKRGREYISIEFIISSQKIKNFDVIKNLVPESNKPGEIHDQLNSIGVTISTIKHIIKTYDEPRIRAAIAYTESQLKLGKVKNPGGFIVDAIKNEYRDSQAEEQQKKQKVRKQKEDKEKRDKELEKQQSLHNKAAIENYLNSLTKDQFLELEAEFLEAYKNDACVMEKYRKERLQNPTVKGCFGAFILKKLSQLKEANV